jgi:hypothetical protein
MLNVGAEALLGETGAVKEVTAGLKLYVMLAEPLPDWDAPKYVMALILVGLL